eukprot:5032357-Amphidinium_carterae.1
MTSPAQMSTLLAIAQATGCESPQGCCTCNCPWQLVAKQAGEPGQDGACWRLSVRTYSGNNTSLLHAITVMK